MIADDYDAMRAVYLEAVMVKQMTRRHYLTLKAMNDTNCGIVLAIEAVASTAIEHPEWDMNEVKTWDEWEGGD